MAAADLQARFSCFDEVEQAQELVLGPQRDLQIEVGIGEAGTISLLSRNLGRDV